ncbi:c-type cytochrome [Actibacterium pelagium]|uniref:c-type cytochrome n=1 Tax=Actibacterium pelagium TaxID=2029103 RepID=UPI001E289F67|nr:cytochrome c [Actibacterium pelagium]
MAGLGALAGAAVLGVWILLTDDGKPDDAVASGPVVLANVAVPASLSANAQIGEKAFNSRCIACHGPNASGIDGAGPPLIHKIYEPSHHGDESFQRAVAVGVRSHHWRFGDMQPQDGFSRADVTYIIAYIRELQRHNGIN